MSWRGLRGTLKSPPRIRVPSWNGVSALVSSWKKVTCFLFGVYIFVRVNCLPWQVPFRIRNLPSLSECVSVSWKGQCFAKSMETPFDLDARLVA